MRAFARLYNELDATTATTRKLDALKKYFSANEPGNAAWAVYFLAGGEAAPDRFDQAVAAVFH